MVYIVDDDEIIFYAHAHEIPAYFDDFITLFLKQARYFLIFVVASILLEIFLGFFEYMHKEEIIRQVTNTHRFDYEC